MARRRQSSLLDDLFEIMQGVFTAVSPWISIPVAMAGYFASVVWFKGKITAEIGHLFGLVFAIACLAGGYSGFRTRQQKAAFLRQNLTLDLINALPWQQFESLAGEIFQARGYSVEHTGGGGADGGVDLRLTKDGQTVLVQCKRWKVFKVGVRHIRELYGVMAAEGVDRAIFISSGLYTNEALRFAEGKALELVDGAQFAEMARAFQTRLQKPTEPTHKTPLADITPDRPLCPVCGCEMVLRKARAGSNAGQEFWGCSNFPKCRGTRQLTQTSHANPHTALHN